MKRLAERKFNKSIFAVLFLLGVSFYFWPGEWVKLEKDSIAYLQEYWRQGVMPFYPFFLNMFKRMLGEGIFLNGVVAAQSILAIVCTMIFTVMLQKQFQLTGWECILVYLICMLPFSIYLPEYGITHMILTEGITYSLFYLYFTTLLKGVWNLKIRWYLLSALMAILLCLTRSQMIFLQVMEILLFGWIVYRRVPQGRLKKLACVLAALLVSGFIALLSYKVIYGIAAWNMQILNASINANDAEAAEGGILGGSMQESKTSEVEILDKATSQFDNLILSRGFFEADAEDEALFDDPMMKELFRKTYGLLDEGEHLYIYVKPGLYMWEKLVYDGVGNEVTLSIMEYDKQHPGSRSKGVGEISRELGLKIMVKHFDRYLYHTIRLMMPSFIAAVFFQIRPIYLLCHFIALFIYLFALAEIIYSVKKKADKHKIEFMAAIFIFVVIMVVIINIVFIGIQRYMVYGMGIFYCALYLLVKDTILLPIWYRLKGKIVTGWGDSL